MTITETVAYDQEMDRNVFVGVVTDEGIEKSVSFGEGEPEDMILTRDLNGAYSIVSMLKLAYDAGKRGEKLKIINKREEW